MKTQFVKKTSDGNFATYRRKGFATMKDAKRSLGILRWRQVQMLPGGFVIFAEA